MAAKAQYTKEFRKKVVEEYRKEYRKGGLSLDEVATKYGISPALLQDWVNKDDVENIFIIDVNKPVKDINMWSKLQLNAGLVYQKIKANGWLMAAGMSMLIPFITFITCNKHVVESEFNDNHHSLQQSYDSIVILNTELNNQIKILSLTLDKINKKLNYNLSPTTTIIYDHRRWNRYKRTKFSNVRNDNRTNTSGSKVFNNDSTTIINIDSVKTNLRHGRGCCCCRCKRDSLK